MDFQNITTADCLLPGQTEGKTLPISSGGTVPALCGPAGGNLACLDLEYAATHLTECPGAATITGLEVRPGTATVQTNGFQQFLAYLIFSNGKTKDVTEAAQWSTLNGLKAAVNTVGLVKGIAAGATNVQAQYLGYFDDSAVTVLAECFQSGLDVVMVIDKSGSMNEVGPDGQTRMAKSITAAAAFIANMHFTKDQVSIMSFAGIIEERVGVTTKSPDVTVHVELSANKFEVLAALQTISVNEPCSVNPSEGVQLYRCATGIGGALQAANVQLTGPRAKAGSRKVVVLLTDGMENICNPDPVPVAAAMAADNISIVIIALAVPDETVVLCDTTTSTAHTFLEDLTTCGLFFDAPTPDDLLDIYSRLVWRICDGNKNNSCFYYFYPIPVPPEPGCSSPQLDYFGFRNWDVVSGNVDLCGVGSNNVALYDEWTGNGLYVDLIGTDQQQPNYALKNTRGILQSKVMYSLNPATYKLSMKLAGNKRQDTYGAALQVKVTVGSLITPSAQVVSITDFYMPFTLYTWTFVVSGTPVSANIRIEHLPLPLVKGKPMTPTIGTFLDNVKLENVTTAEVLLNDTFDSENPC